MLQNINGGGIMKVQDQWWTAVGKACALQQLFNFNDLRLWNGILSAVELQEFSLGQYYVFYREQ